MPLARFSKTELYGSIQGGMLCRGDVPISRRCFLCGEGGIRCHKRLGWRLADRRSSGMSATSRCPMHATG